MIFRPVVPILLLVPSLLLFGCAGSPVHTSSLSLQQLQRVDNYTLCKGATPREAYYPSQMIFHEVRRRGLDCSLIYNYAGTAGTDALIRGLGGVLEAAKPQQNSPTYGGRATGTAFLRSQSVSGHNRICIYDRMGSAYAITIGAAQLCPISQ